MEWIEWVLENHAAALAACISAAAALCAVVALVVSATATTRDDIWLRRTARRFRATWAVIRGKRGRDTLEVPHDE